MKPHGLANAKTVNLRSAGPRLAGPRLAEPRLAGPKLAEPRLAEPRLGERLFHKMFVIRKAESKRRKAFKLKSTNGRVGVGR